MGRAIWLFLFMLLILPCDCADSCAGESFFRALAEGFSSVTLSQGIKAGERLFTVNDTPEICGGPHPSRLVAHEDHITVLVGSSFHLQDLSIVAIDGAGNVMGPVPLVLETNAPYDILDTSDFRAFGGGIRTLRPGRFQILIRPYCSGPPGSPEPKITVHYTVK